MEKIDLKKDLKYIYSPTARRSQIVDIPEFQFVMIDGKGNPNTSSRFTQAIETLYPMVYHMKFSVKKEMKIDYPVMPLEGLYWGTPKGLTRFTDEDKEKWSWTLMMMVPEIITKEIFNEKRSGLKEKKDPALIDEIRFDRFCEGKVVQQMHIGPYDGEWKTVEPMHEYARDQGFELAGKHHEIYVGDPRRADPEKLKTIVRHPIKKIGKVE